MRRRSSTRRKPQFGAAIATVCGFAWACSVFPDELDWPAENGGAGGAGEAAGGSLALGGNGSLGGEPSLGGSANATSGGDTSPGGDSSLAGERSVAGGATSLGGSVNSTGGAANGGTRVTAEAGSAGTPPAAGGNPAGCANPATAFVQASADTWIDSSNTGTNHGQDTELHVVNGSAIRRAVLSFSWNTGIVPERAELRLNLVDNAAQTRPERRLGLALLAQIPDESKTDWMHFGSGSRKWANPGGDFGPELGQLIVPAGSGPTELRADVSALLVTGQSRLDLMLLEDSAAPAAPSDLSFASREDPGQRVPQLALEFCQ